VAEQPFTEEDIQLAARAIVQADRASGSVWNEPVALHLVEARAVLAALAEAGRLRSANTHTQAREEFAVFQQKSGGVDVSKFVDKDGYDTETRAKDWAEEFGGEVKRRLVTTVYGPWAPVEEVDRG
jgi:hypothetical protein